MSVNVNVNVRLGFKWAVKIGYFVLIIGMVLFYLWSFTNKSKNKSPIDKTITYTTATQTFTTPLKINPSPEEIVESISDYVIVPEEGLDWKILAGTKSIPYEYTDADGQSVYGVAPEFSDKLNKYDQQIVTMQGYMFPLNADESQNMFLFGPFPISCPYHYHVGPALVIETFGLEPIEFRYEPITIKGTLELVNQGNEYSIFYRLRDVELLE